MSSDKYVGSGQLRQDALEKVTGKAIYVGAVNFPNMACGKILLLKEKEKQG